MKAFKQDYLRCHPFYAKFFNKEIDESLNIDVEVKH